MATSSLIKSCVCGGWEFLNGFVHLEVPVNVCLNCGIIHQDIKMDEIQYLNFYKTEYHEYYQKLKGVTPYPQRYKNDKAVAGLRLAKYDKFVPKQGKILDLGSGNGAFVDRAIECGYDAIGVDLTESKSDRVINGPLESILPTLGKFDLITLHDVVEHLINPKQALLDLKNHLSPNGCVVIDFPDFFSKGGFHHWKVIEHIWFFKEVELVEFVQSLGLKVIHKDKPIPGKIVIYATISE